MWDAGLPDFIAALPEHTLRRGTRFRFVLPRTLADQLARAGFAPEDIDFLALSHMQIDHAGNAGLFTRARTLVQEAEFAIAFGPDAARWGYYPRDFAVLAGRSHTLLSGDYDVFGDGSVLILSAPGHTPGHQVLLVRLTSGPVLLSGDLYYAAGDPAAYWMPAWNVDPAGTLRTMQRLDKITADTAARWIINHDPNPAPPVVLAPEWME
jgi:glyoxylase-like metal-dependent hydrolase (beta-lactamase superfamily II)